MLGNMLNVIIFLPICDFPDFQINLGFRIKPFYFMMRKPGQKFKYIKNEK